MMPRIRAALAACPMLFTATVAFAQTGAGTVPLALVQQFGPGATPLAGCLLYSFVAGTVATPAQGYADYGLTQPLPNPVTCDQTGRVPMIWYPAGLIHIRLTDASGVVQVDTTMQVLGPSSGGGGGGSTVDPTTIMATGDMKSRYGTGPLSGFVRANGLTIGSAVSGATERANADCQNLFTYLWTTDPTLAVSGGRGASAATDWTANKTITLPDMRGRVIAGLDDMGNSAAGRLTSTYFGVGATTLGASGGSQSQAIAQANLPSGVNLNPNTATVSTNQGDVIFTTNIANGILTNQVGGAAGFPWLATFGAASINLPTYSLGGSGTPLASIQPTELMTIYIKL